MRKIKVPTKEERRIAELEQTNIANMMAMTEMYETNLKLEQTNVETMIALTELYEMTLGGQ